MKRVLTTSGVALLCTLAANAQAVEVTANIGYMSGYIFRGISQGDSSAMGGVDASIKESDDSDSGETSLMLSVSKSFSLVD